MREHKRPLNTIEVPWKIMDVIFFVLVLVAMNIAIGIAWNYFQWEYGNTTSIALSYLLQLCLSALVFWRFALRNKKVTRAHLSLRWLPFGDTVGYIVGAYIVYAALVILIIIISTIFSIPAPGFESQESYLELFGNSVGGIVLLGVIAIGIAPIVEELIFRVFILQTIASRVGVWPGILVSSAIFAAVHFEFASFSILFMLGCVMGYLFISKRSLQLSILFHVFNNAIAFIAELLLGK